MLDFSVYITAHTVVRRLSEPEERTRAVQILRQIGAGSVILESYRGGCVAPEAALRELGDFFQGEGFSVLGGIMPVHGEGFGKRGEGVETRFPCFCYSDEETVEALGDQIVLLAGLFNEVVIDDGLSTSCRCATCAERRGNRDWGVFRRGLLCEAAADWVRRAHEAHPGSRVIVKFPQYYDRYHRFGYDAKRFPDIFDAVWQGTETRDPATLDYGYVEPYEGYFNVLWMRACAGPRLEGAWFDSLDCDDQLFYDQAVTTALAAPARVTLFSYDADLLESPMIRRLVDGRRRLDRLHEVATSPMGVHVVKPPNSDPGRDSFVFDDLGMLGVPCVPAANLESTMRSAFLPAHAAAEPATQRLIPRALMAGRHIITTTAGLHRMAHQPGLLEFFGYRPSGVAPGHAPIESFEIAGGRVPVRRPLHLAGDLEPVDAAVLAWAELAPASGQGRLRVPFVTAKSFASGGRAVVWNLETFGEEAFEVRERFNVPIPSQWSNMPCDVADLLRKTATTALGFTIAAPPRVASFVFEKHLVFVNYGAFPAEVAVAGLDWDRASLESDSPDTTCVGESLRLAPRSHAILTRRR